jgi:ligand-binding sensor domain-containing protein
MSGIRRSFVIYVILLVSLPYATKGQEYNYVHYKTNDGLAGAVVYDLCQDNDGFIWFATETGLSRFDGSHFKNFTMDDGLPSNEILKVFADTKGRVWICPFKKMICYYYQGKIFTPQNDSLLKQIRLNGFVNLICEDVDKNILLIANAEAILVNNKTENVYYYPGMNISATVANYPDKGFLLATRDTLYKIIDNKINFWKLSRKSNSPDSLLISFPTGKEVVIKKKAGITLLDFKDGELQYINSLNGSWEMNSSYPFYREHFLPDKTVNHTLKDREHNIWFATMGDGVYKLGSKEIRTFLSKRNIYSVDTWQGTIVIGSDGKELYTLTNGKIDTLFLDPLFQRAPHYINFRVYSTKKLATGDII